MENIHWDLEFANLTAYILVFARMCGMLLLNPFLGRRNVPARYRVALLLGLTMVLAPGVTLEHLSAQGGMLSFVLALFLELFVGFVCSFVFQLFYYMLFFAGDLLDVEFGLSMAKVFDPGTNIQMSMTSTMFNIVFALYFFATNSHLVLIKVVAASFDVVPIGGAVITAEVPDFMLGLFGALFSLVIRLTLPFVAAMFVAEVSMGVLMKLVPQIHVFVISIQFKITLSLLLMLFFASPVTNFIDNFMELLFLNMEDALFTLLPPA